MYEYQKRAIFHNPNDRILVVPGVTPPPQAKGNTIDRLMIGSPDFSLLLVLTDDQRVLDPLIHGGVVFWQVEPVVRTSGGTRGGQSREDDDVLGIYNIKRSRCEEEKKTRP